MDYHQNPPHQSFGVSQTISAAPKSQPIDDSLGRLEKQASALRDLVTRLTSRLDPILSPAGANGESSMTHEPRAMPAPLVTKIDDLTEFLRTSYADLQDIDCRLAL